MTKPVPPIVAKLLKTRLNRFVRALDGFERGEMAGLHRTRVASRRMRELVPILHIDPRLSRKFARRLRKVTGRLGIVRELDVLLLLIDELHVSRPIHRPALRRVRARVASDRETARKRLRRRVSVDQLRRLGRKLDRVVEQLRESNDESTAKTQLAATREVRWAIDARVANRAERLNAAMTAAGAVYLPERLHDVRIASKKLRYALELSEELRGERGTPIVRALKRMQTLLGRMHDLQMLIARVRDVQASLAPASLSGWRELDDLVNALEDMCRRLHARYVRERVGIEEVTRRAGTPGHVARARGERKVG